MTKREKMIEHYSNKPGAVRHEANDFVVISYTENSIFAVAIWQYRSEIKPYLCGFRTAEEAQKHTEHYQTKSRWEAERKAAAEIEAKARAAKIQTGTIFSSSWGYEQTNVDFYLCTERKGASVTLQPIGSKVVESNGYQMTGKVVANPEKFIDEPMKKRINKHGGITLNSFSSCSIWDGQPKVFSSYA